jgi:hypothetical protein
MENLDLACAKLGQDLAEPKDNGKSVKEVFTAALGVLDEQGPYACFLYLQAREGKAGEQIIESATERLRGMIGDKTNAKDPLQFLQDLAMNLDQLLFARDLLRQALIYARYHAKARNEAEK